MADAQEVSTAVLRILMEFFKKLNSEQVDQLLNKSAQLALLAPGASVASPGVEATGLSLVVPLLRRISPDDLEHLLSKRGQLAYLPPGATIVPPAITNSDIKSRLAEVNSRQEALSYLAGLKLKVADLKA